MHQVQIDRLVSQVPPEISDVERRRLHAYQETARRCEQRIQRLREELERALQATVGRSAHGRPGAKEHNAVLDVAVELDGLERVQPRVDGWLEEHVAALSSERVPHGYGDAESYGDDGPM